MSPFPPDKQPHTGSDRDADKMLDAQTEAPRSPGALLGRGVLMGLAEVVPGVSGGTMAFITGIYHELVSTLAAFGPKSVPMLAQPMNFFRVHNLRFLLWLGAGMLLGVLLFAQVMQYLLSVYQPVVWAFFCGVIVMSAWVIGRSRVPKLLLGFLPIGLCLGLSILFVPLSLGTPSLLMVFVGGAVAVCAWLLPAVSGSYMLLVLGLYAPVIAAIAAFDVTIMAVMAAGCAVGLLLFARALNWLLHHYTEALLSFLVGFMLGSLPKLWPWQLPQQGDLLSTLVAPSQYTAGNPYVSAVVCAFVGGILALGLLSKYTYSE